MTQVLAAHAKLLRPAVDIVAAFISNNRLPVAELPSLIERVHAALIGLGESEVVATTPQPAALVPAVPVKKSITPDFLICLDDGKKFKSMRRHLTQLGMTPDEYRTKWNLPGDYPMVAANYAAARSALAKQIGLGKGSRTKPAPAIEVKKRGRPKNVAAAV